MTSQVYSNLGFFRGDKIESASIPGTGTLSGKSVAAIDPKAKSQSGYSTTTKVLMAGAAIAGTAAVAVCAAYAMGYFSGQAPCINVVPHDTNVVPHASGIDPTKIIDSNSFTSLRNTLTPTRAFPQSIYSNPEYLFEGEAYRTISVSEMNEFFGQTTLLPDEQRDVYNRFAQASTKYAFQAMDATSNNETKFEISKMAFHNRESVMEYTRESGYRIFEWGAMARDRIKYGTWERSFDDIAKKYKYNATLITEKAGSPNTEVNFLANVVSPLMRNPIVQVLTTGIEGIVVDIDNGIRGDDSFSAEVSVNTTILAENLALMVKGYMLPSVGLGIAGGLRVFAVW